MIRIKSLSVSYVLLLLCLEYVMVGQVDDFGWRLVVTGIQNKFRKKQFAAIETWEWLKRKNWNL